MTETSWCRCDYSSMANALRSLWPISTSQSSPYHCTPRLALMESQSLTVSLTSDKVDAYVFFHLPGQFLNEDSLSKVRLWLVGHWVVEVLLPEVVKLIFSFKVEVTVGKKLWIELTYEILRQVNFLQTVNVLQTTEIWFFCTYLFRRAPLIIRYRRGTDV